MKKENIGMERGGTLEQSPLSPPNLTIRDNSLFTNSRIVVVFNHNAKCTIDAELIVIRKVFGVAGGQGDVAAIPPDVLIDC